ncbi:MAG: hypothetical protein JWM85_240 [Acidimicrobiaceae bacterium]|nr:hypothetical protein [Acidimicrobiaceae bacterium]
MPGVGSHDVAETAAYTHVRVLCLDADGRLLLMKWRDPVDGHETWEPPGGAVEPGETLLDAAVRELGEETGLRTVVFDRYVLAQRDDMWKGEARRRAEPCFFSPVGEAEVVPDMPTAQESESLIEWRFVRQADIDRLDAPVYPPDPFSLVSELLGC